VSAGDVWLSRIGRIHQANLAKTVLSAHLVRVSEEFAGAARACGRALGGPWSTAWEDVVGDPGVEGVVSATPVATHARLIARAARAGNHVFCEKPLATSAAEAQEALAAVERAG